MAPRVDPVPSDEVLPARADVVIVGGGIIGTSTALFLAQKGVRAVLCEKVHIAGEQSSRNWGWCRKMGRDPRELPLIIESLRLWQGMNELVEAETGFRQAGIMMMFPSLRGGNENSGPKEGFLGEVDDILAAADFLAKQEYVDPQRIYLGGHSTGGTLVLLTADCTDRFVCALCDQGTCAEHAPGPGCPADGGPYDPGDAGDGDDGGDAGGM